MFPRILIILIIYNNSNIIDMNVILMLSQILTILILIGMFLCRENWSGPHETLSNWCKFGLLFALRLTPCRKLSHSHSAFSWRGPARLWKGSTHICSSEVWIHLVAKAFPFLFIPHSRSSLCCPFICHYYESTPFTKTQNKRCTFTCTAECVYERKTETRKWPTLHQQTGSPAPEISLSNFNPPKS